jgi:hypothetical protein
MFVCVSVSVSVNLPECVRMGPSLLTHQMVHGLGLGFRVRRRGEWALHSWHTSVPTPHLVLRVRACVRILFMPDRTVLNPKPFSYTT